VYGLWLGSDYFVVKGPTIQACGTHAREKNLGMLIDVDVCHDGIDDGHQRETSLADCIELKYAQTDLLCSFYFIG
jgi:hypothetical protein